MFYQCNYFTHIYEKAWETVPVTRPTVPWPSHCLSCQNEQRRSPRRYVYTNTSHENTGSSKGAIYTPREHLPLLCLRQDLKLRSSEPSRSKRQVNAFPINMSPPSTRLHPKETSARELCTNIVKGERRDKSKTQFSILTLPNRILYYQNIVKGERRDK